MPNRTEKPKRDSICKEAAVPLHEGCSSCKNTGPICDCILQLASRIAGTLPPAEAREVVRQLFFERCSGILGSGDREELLDDVFARRARVWGDFFAGTGLRPDPSIPGSFLPGSWSLRGEWRGSCSGLVIRGVYASNGLMVSVPLSAKQFLSTAATLRAVTRAVGAKKWSSVSSSEWRRVWNGFEHRGPGGTRQWVVGLRYRLHQEFVARGGLIP